MSYLETTARLIILRCDAYMRRKGVSDSLKKFPCLIELAENYDNSEMEKWTEAEEFLRQRKTTSDDMEVLRYRELLDLTDADDVTRNLVDLAIAQFYYPEFEEYIAELFGSRVNLKLAYLLEEMPFPDEKDVLKKAEKLSTFFGIDLRKSPVFYQDIRMDDRTVAFLSGDDSPDSRVLLYGYLFYPENEYNEPFINREMIERGTCFFENGGKALQLSGRGGRRFIAGHIFRKMGRKALFIDLKEISNSMGENFYRIRNLIIREALFQKGAICIYGISDELLKGGDDYKTEILEKSLLSHIMKCDIPLILCCDLNVRLIREPLPQQYRVYELKEVLSFDEKKKLWEGFSSLYGLDINPNEAAMRYQLTASETMRMVRGLLDAQDDINSEKSEEMSKLAMATSGIAGTLKLGRIIYPRTRLTDVKLKSSLKKTIENAIGSARISHRIFDEWGLKDNYQYGSAISILLSGPPGTGKTMSANAIAGELGIPLYQINLSNVVDKYIGETEKNLERIFSFAEKTNVVLFFDEADSIFGKRSDVKDSKDKYANNETSYLLQRMETYNGIVILATNIKGNIDPAFMRRIRYVIQYDTPDADVRRQIWESLITEKIPHEELDIEYLSEQFEDFTGSTIKTIFLNACSVAAASDESLSMKHLVRAIKGELSKGSTINMSLDTLGKYSYL